MGLSRIRLGDFIEQVTETNDGSFTVNDVYGMTITKEFIPTKANVKETNLSNFIVVRPADFVYNPRTHGKHIGFGYNNTERPLLISRNNGAFRIRSDKLGELDSLYLFMHFNRDEWDRWACFSSWGSSTEVFTWDALCDMSLDLPPIEVQQKYVAIYKAMLANQRVYEKGLADLKLTCDILLDRCKTSERWMRVGDCVEEVDRRNLDISCDMAFGININKQFMSSKVSSDDLHNYKLVAPGELAYSSMQTGRDKCIRIALHEGHEDIAVSPAYSILQEKSDSMLPIKYLMMWFSRPEMDRLGWFLSDASIRANLDLSEFLNIKIPVPDKPVQDAVIKIYDAWKTRAGINGRIKKRLKDICPILVKGSIEEARR